MSLHGDSQFQFYAFLSPTAKPTEATGKSVVCQDFPWVSCLYHTVTDSNLAAGARDGGVIGPGLAHLDPYPRSPMEEQPQVIPHLPVPWPLACSLGWL